MKKIILFFGILTSVGAFADTKISDLPLGSAAATNINDSFPYVDSASVITKRLKLSDLPNIPQLASVNKRTTNTVSTNLSVPSLSKDYILNVNASLGDVSITLPSSSSSDTFCIKVKKISSSNNVNIGTTLSQTIDGLSSDSLTTPNESKEYCAVGGNWFIY